MKDDQWKAIPGLEGYEASYGGHVRSVDRVLADGRFCAGTVLREKPDRDGYLLVKAARRWVPVHHLVMLAWIGECPEGMERLHGDGGQADNSAVNLRYGTHWENEQDKKKGKERLKLAGGPEVPPPLSPVTPFVTGLWAISS